MVAKVLQTQAKALFHSSELQYYPGCAYSNSGSPATSMTSPRRLLCSAGEVPPSGHPCFPWSTMRQNHVADGAGRAGGGTRGWHLVPGRGCKQGHPHQPPAFRRCQQAQDFGHSMEEGMLVAQATVCQGASIPSSGLSRQMAAGMHRSLAVHGDLSSAPTLE